MGIFSRKSHQSRRQQPDTVVLCAFRELTDPEPLRNFNPEHAYAYRWALPVPPAVGQWAIVDRHDGSSTIIVGAIGVNSYVTKVGAGSLASITRLVPFADVERARALVAQKLADERAAEATWLAHCRWVAGIDTNAPTNPLPTGFDKPQLPREAYDPGSAHQHGSSWWHAYKKSEELQRPAAESERFKDIARTWYRIRDTNARAEQLSSVRSVADGVDLDQAIRDLENGKDFGDQPGNFLGKPMWDWLRYVEELAKAGEPAASKALPLVYALIVVAERAAKISGREPAPAYTWRAAILHRKRKEYREEVAVLERWEAACPPERRGPGAMQPKLAQRLIKARELANKHSASAQ
ncbi:hypothetical protein [Amycolatopsis sp. NPDC058986]|uniref:hypothetical protein n=1 Tax=unclassified Amycolatopsis TaxID=2618356 RepID=UPI00366E257D